MNFNIVLSWSIVLLAVIALVLYLKEKNRKKDEKTLEPLLALAREQNAEISQYNSWDRSLIGIDNNESGKMFFIRSIPGMQVREVIDLSEVADCKMVKIERKVKYNKEIVTVTDRILLVISFLNHKPEIRLEFYNDDYDQLTLSGELQLAQSWTSLIKSILIKNQASKKKNTEYKSAKPSVIVYPQNKLVFVSNRKYKRPEKLSYAV
jgi:hypothetical protein